MCLCRSTVLSGNAVTSSCEIVEAGTAVVGEGLPTSRSKRSMVAVEVGSGEHGVWGRTPRQQLPGPWLPAGGRRAATLAIQSLGSVMFANVPIHRPPSVDLGS
jgi:hypothetical protein